jgi:SAM-dependent methyltransferase
VADLAKEAVKYGISIKSSTPGSPLNDFIEFTALDEALALSEKKTIQPPSEILHAVDAEKIYSKEYENTIYRMGGQRYEHAVKYIGQWQKGRLLDIGCGRGEILDFAEGKGFEAKGTEIVEELIDNTRVVKGYTHELPFENNSFDYVTCFDVIEHILPENTAKTFEEIDRVAQKSILLSIANYPSKFGNGIDLHINIKPYPKWDGLIRKTWPNALVTWLPPGNNISETWLIEKEGDHDNDTI